MGLSRQKKDSSTSKLEDAIKILTAFNNENEHTEENSLQKTIHLMRDFFAARFSDKSRQEIAQKNQQDTSKLLNAIDILKSHFIFLEKLLHGSPQQQKLAASALAAIDRYNTIIENAQSKNSSLRSRIDAFFAENNETFQAKDLARIHLPPLASLQKKYGAKEKSEEFVLRKVTLQKLTLPTSCQKKIFHLSQMVVPVFPLPLYERSDLSKQAIELFHMKAISLIEKHGLLSNSEARAALRKTPLNIVSEDSVSSCTASCTLIPFPGHTIAVTGSFKKDPSSGKYSIPDPQSFFVSFASTQTGFPHPLQHHGGGFPDLLPLFPHDLDKMPLFKSLYERKRNLACMLLNDEKMIAYAKHLISLRRAVFEDHFSQFIELHQQLCTAIVTAAPESLVQENMTQIIQHYFQRLKHLHAPFDYLAETYGIIHETFVIRPLEKLQQMWLEADPQSTFVPENIFKNEINRNLKELRDQHQIAQSELEQSAINFIAGFGALFGISCLPILLQQLSESMKFSPPFSPPLLNEFEKKIQAANFKQQEAFLNDFENSCFDENGEIVFHEDDENIGKLKDKIGSLLDGEINLFKGPLHPSRLASELEAYYRDRSAD